jgi:hypothetical protein
MDLTRIHHLVAALIQPFGILTGCLTSILVADSIHRPSRYKIVGGSLVLSLFGGYFMSQKYLKWVVKN